MTAPAIDIYALASEGDWQTLATTDPMTGVPSRLGWWLRAQEALAAHDVAALLLLDLDRFKSINDTFGHAAGDAVLREVAERLAAAVGADGIVGRLAGDEFAIAILAHADVDTTRVAADCTGAVERTSVRLDDEQRIRVRVSIGAAVQRDGDDLSAMLARADAAMYQAKRSRHRHAGRQAVERRSHRRAAA